MCTATWGVRYHLFLLVSVVRLLEGFDRTQIHDRRGLFVRKRESIFVLIRHSCSSVTPESNC